MIGTEWSAPVCGGGQETTDPTTPRPVRSAIQRWLYASLGVACVALAAIGVVLPGLPTTVFLLAASWLFTRSCPWLEERLLGLPLFAPFRAFLVPGARMPRRVAAGTLLVMWAAIAVSAGLLIAGDPSRSLIAAAVVAAGLVGSVFVLRFSRARPGPTAEEDASSAPHGSRGRLPAAAAAAVRSTCRPGPAAPTRCSGRRRRAGPRRC
jgi:uncharacterized membrane protein YbaN (DUF454 family)